MGGRVRMNASEQKKHTDLLVICHSYNSFQKDQTDLVAPQFSSVHVLVRINPFADIGMNFPLFNLGNYTSEYKIDKHNLPDNTTVYPTKVWYFPTERGYRMLGERHLASVEAQIRDHTIKFDLVHAHFTWSSGYVGAKLKERYGVNFIVTAHGYDIYSLPFTDAVWKEKIEYVLNTADAIITVSQKNLACIRKLGVTTPTYIIPNGFRKDLFYPRDTATCRSQLRLPMDKKILLTVGYLDFSDKGQNYLVEAIKKVIPVRNDIFCVIIGVGKDKQALEKQIRSSGLEKHVMLAGGKPHSEIAVWMNACDVFVLPSLQEGNPTVLVECLGCGKPFVGTNVGGVPEVITSEKYGLLAEPANPDELAEKILDALDREWDREAILRYSERFAWNEISEEIINVYNSVV